MRRAGQEANAVLSVAPRPFARREMDGGRGDTV